MKKEKIIQELYSLGIKIDLKNPADIYFLNIIEEKTGEDRKKFFDFFCKYKIKRFKRRKKIILEIFLIMSFILIIF